MFNRMMRRNTEHEKPSKQETITKIEQHIRIAGQSRMKILRNIENIHGYLDRICERMKKQYPGCEDTNPEEVSPTAYYYYGAINLYDHLRRVREPLSRANELLDNIGDVTYELYSKPIDNPTSEQTDAVNEWNRIAKELHPTIAHNKPLLYNETSEEVVYNGSTPTDFTDEVYGCMRAIDNEWGLMASHAKDIVNISNTVGNLMGELKEQS